MSMIHSFGVVSSLLLSAVAIGQDVDANAARAAHGVYDVEGEVRAGGPEYTARFDGRGVEFTPLLGRAAERPFPVRFTMDSVRRGAGDVFVRTADVVPVVDGNHVRFVHGTDLTEVYDVRAEGIEQSFVFGRRPAGSGDLVVRGAITTELPLASASDDGVRYEREGLGGVTFGAVTGVDANGATARGSIRVAADGAHVERVLPAAFVDHAAYPMVLDPLIGSAFAVGNAPGGTDLHPAIAFDATTSRYYAVWMVATGPTSGEVRGQLLSASGNPLGSLNLHSTIADNACRPRVANVNATDRFLVAWGREYVQGPNTIRDYVCASVSAANGTVSSTLVLPVSPYPFASLQVAVGGDRRDVLGSDTALVVMQGSWPSLAGQRVQVPAVGNPVLVGTDFLYSFELFDSVAISSTCGVDGRWLAAWTQDDVTDAVRCMAIGETGVACTPMVQLAGGSATAVGNVSVATRGGTEFVVAWQDDVTGTVRVQPLALAGLCPTTITLGTAVEPVTAAGLQSHPAIEFAKDKYVLAWSQMVAGTGLRTFVKGLDPVTCATCGPEHALEATLSVQDQAAIASRWSGGVATSDEVMVVWSTGTIRGARFEARSNDVVTSMGGACSASGFDDFATYNGDAVLGATDFELVLFNPVSLPLVMILGFSAIAAPCGSCTIMPSLDILFPATNPLPLAIPCDPLLVGVDLYTQWLLLKPSDCPILPDFAFSNSLRFTIGE